MPTVIRRQPYACPKCSLSLTVVHTDEGVSIEYEVTEWARLCHHPSCGSPLACPALESDVRDWLGDK